MKIHRFIIIYTFKLSAIMCKLKTEENDRSF